MSASGVKSLRMMLVTPYENSYKVIAYCNQKGIEVLLMVPLTLDVYYTSPVFKRPGNKSLYTVPGFSALNLVNFESNWGAVMEALSSRHLRVKGIQIGNEFNSAAFNGDLPLVKGGAFLTTQNYGEFAFWTAFEAGMGKLVQVLRVVSTSLEKSESFKDVPVILGGLARPTTHWMRNVDGTLVEPDLALKVLLGLGADRYIDVYAIHLYPMVLCDQLMNPELAIREYIDKRMASVVAVTGTAKGWWITEWGFATQNIGLCKNATEERTPLFRAFQEAVGKSRWANLLGPSFIYDWDESNNFRIYNNGTVLCTDNISKL